MISICWCWCLRRCAEPAHITLDRKTWFKTLVAKSWKLIFSFKAQEDGVVRPISLVTRPIPFKWIYKANSFVLLWKFKICKITSLHNLDIQPLVNLDDLCIYHWLFVIPTERRVQQCTIQSSTQWKNDNEEKRLPSNTSQKLSPDCYKASFLSPQVLDSGQIEWDWRTQDATFVPNCDLSK